MVWRVGEEENEFIMNVTIDLKQLARKYNGVYMNINRLAMELGTSTRTAGKILARMEKLGLAIRVSKRVYLIVYMNYTR